MGRGHSNKSSFEAQGGGLEAIFRHGSRRRINETPYAASLSLHSRRLKKKNLEAMLRGGEETQSAESVVEAHLGFSGGAGSGWRWWGVQIAVAHHDQAVPRGQESTVVHDL